MIRILPRREGGTICAEVNGELTAEDARKVDEYAEDMYGDKEQINVLAIFKELEGTTIQSLLKGMKVDMKRWN